MKTGSARSGKPLSGRVSRGRYIGVLYGGLSSEREVSLRTGRAVISALRSRGYRVVGIDAGRDLARQLVRKKIEVVFNALHGRLGEDGSVQGLLEVMGIPYTGPGVLASSLGMDKYLSRVIFQSHRLTVPRFVRIIRGTGRRTLPPIERELGGYPLMVKPRSEGSSVGVEKVSDRKELQAAIAKAARFGDDVLIETFLEGTEVHVGVLKGKVLGDVEVVPHEDFYNYQAKYTPGKTEYILPARVSKRERRLVHQAAVKATHAIGCEGIPRIDFIVSRGRPYLLEVNTLPGLTEMSLIPKIAEMAGLDYPRLVEMILRTAALKTIVRPGNRAGERAARKSR